MQKTLEISKLSAGYYSTSHTFSTSSKAFISSLVKRKEKKHPVNKINKLVKYPVFCIIFQYGITADIFNSGNHTWICKFLRKCFCSL